jgi:hypothetical protein
MDDKQKTQAYLEGYAAFKTGASNPYHPKEDNEKFFEWEDGYHAANAEAEGTG